MAAAKSGGAEVFDSRSHPTAIHWTKSGYSSSSGCGETGEGDQFRQCECAVLLDFHIARVVEQKHICQRNFAVQRNLAVQVNIIMKSQLKKSMWKERHKLIGLFESVDFPDVTIARSLAFPADEDDTRMVYRLLNVFRDGFLWILLSRMLSFFWSPPWSLGRMLDRPPLDG